MELISSGESILIILCALIALAVVAGIVYLIVRCSGSSVKGIEYMRDLSREQAEDEKRAEEERMRR